MTAVRESEPVDLDPDDPAIWVNPADPALSRQLRRIAASLPREHVREGASAIAA